MRKIGITVFMRRGRKTPEQLEQARRHQISSMGRIIDGTVTDVKSTALSPSRINGGFFIFKNSIFDHMKEGEELVEQPFRRLIDARQLHTYSYDGFWACMDTFKEKQLLEDLYMRGQVPWEVWKNGHGKPQPGQR